jgi:hypothetical protein
LMVIGSSPISQHNRREMVMQKNCYATPDR